MRIYTTPKPYGPDFEAYFADATPDQIEALFGEKSDFPVPNVLARLRDRQHVDTGLAILRRVS